MAEQADDKKRSRSTEKLDDFLRDIEPFFYEVPIIYVDVGAFVGETFEKVLNSGLRLNQAHLVEPNPLSFEKLRARVDDLDATDKAVCYNLAMSDEEGEQNLRNAGSMSKVLTEEVRDDSAIADRTFTAKTSSLDHLMSALSVEYISLLKIDVEGYETHVLEGARNILSDQRIGLIYIEAGINKNSPQQTYYRDIEDLLQQYGYKLFRIYEQTHEWMEDNPLLRRVNLAFMSEKLAGRHAYRASHDAHMLREKLKEQRLEWTDRLKAERQAAKNDVDLRFAEIAKLTEMLEDQREAARRAAMANAVAQRQLKSDIARLKREAKATNDRRAKDQERITRLETDLEIAINENDEKRAAADQDKIAALETKLAHVMTENERLLNQPRVPSDYNHLKHKLSSLQKELATTRTYAGEIERKHMALLNSRTWQATESVRRVARFVKRRKRPAPFVPRFVNGKDAKVIDGGNVTSSDADGLSKLPVSDMVKKLWGGFSESAKTELTLVSNSANVGRSDKVEASWNLARWEAASGNWQTCLDHLSRIAKLDKSFHQSMRGRVLSFEALIRSGNGAQAIEDANAALSKEINGNFLCAISNALLVQEGAESGSDKRLNRLNEMYADAGIASFSLKDPAHGLVFGNITANAPNSENGMLVSVLVPVFNASDFIEAAIESLLKQTHRNLEVIAVDDASTDDSWEKLEKLAASDARLKISRNDQNLGAYPTRNHALANATGDVITVHDSDDWSHPQMIELQLKALLDNPGLKATFSMMARVLPTMEFLLRPERNNLEYVHMSYPSLMMRREDLEQLDKWDGVFANADDEFVQRLRAKWGKQATKQILPTTPLSFFLRHEQSLTEMKGTHLKSLTFGIRKEYADQARFWRESVFPDKGTQKHADMERRDLKTPFPIPSGLAPRNWARDPVYDLVIISDLSLLGGTRRCNEGYVAAATELGLRVGLFHWPRYDLVLSPVADEYRLLSYQRNVDILVHEDNITCDTVLIHHPPILKHRLDSVPKITARQVGILVNQLPMQRRSQDPHYYFPDDVGELTQDLFGVDPLWIPISALARRMLKEIGGFERIAGTDWLPPLGQTLPPMATFDLSYVGAKRKIVLGRHSRDHPTKWPENAQALKQAYCADTDIAVRLMGGVRTPKTLLGKLPSNWTTLDFDAEPIDSFLSGLDFFVHYVSDDYIEEFGRNAMEAMAVGVPVILPPVFKETFGEAAIYSAPQKVHDTIRALWAEPDLYRAKVQAAYDFVLNTSDQRAVQKRLGGFVQRKTDPAKWADTIIAAE